MKNFRRSILLVRFLPVLFAALLVPSSAGAELIKLDNSAGFKSVYLSHNSNQPTVTVALVILAGEVDVEGPEGLSHYLEHLMYWHADNVDDQRLHVRGGNAWVNGIVTSYYNEAEVTELPDMLSFISRLYTAPELDKAFMLRERSVVAREYDLGVSENPDVRIWTRIRRDLYNELPVSRSVIGTTESINSLTIESALKFHKKHYHPKNSVLFVSGNITSTDLLIAMRQRMLLPQEPPDAAYNANWRSARIEGKSDNTKEFIDSQVSFERLIYLTLSEFPDKSDAVSNWYTLRLLQSILDSALEGGIARPLRMDNFILRSFSLSLDNMLSDYTELTLSAEPDKGVSLQESTAAIKEALQAIARAGIPDATLERVRKRMLQTELRNSGKMWNSYQRIAEQLSAGIPPLPDDQHIKNIEAVSLEDINALLQAIADPQRRTIAHIKPAEK